MKSNARRVGNIEILAIFDGTLRSGLDKIPRPEDRGAAAALLETAPADALVMDVFAFVLRHEGSVDLIDAGTGTLKGPQTGRLWSNLAKEGIAPNSVRRIFFTHLHADHFGGLTDPTGTAVFKNAELIVVEPEARFWLDTPLADMPGRAQRAVPECRAALAPYHDRLTIVPRDAKLGALTALPSPGHTPGHTSWMISSQGETALAWGDVVHIPAIHLPRPRTGMEYDLDVDLAGDTRERILDLVAKQRMLVLGSHLKAPPFAYVVKAGAGFAAAPGDR